MSELEPRPAPTPGASKENSAARERELFDRLKRDPKVIGEVYDAYADRLYGFLMKRCGHKETAEDIVSRTFTKLLESRETLEWRGATLGAWLFRVSSNALADHWRSASHRLESDLNIEEWDPPADDDPAWNAEIRLEGEKLRALMKELAARDQEVLDLKFYGGLETAEIAAALSISPNHAAVLLYRAIGRLRQRTIKTAAPSIAK